MKIPNTCRDVTHLLLAREDRALPVYQRLAIRVHILTCRACQRFERQTLMLRGALRVWREHQDHDDPKPPR
ncbi:zf-HC2 domain-containing protein [Metallibacterium sp.]|jgi:hypothetical protein|uniref:zf-HC2 domain-containing protein n=1 Tax=Metallibacterium sp. TaxID=2940281 RepID=UPI00261EB05D|nr:zf-HC2 domain-containing protein [Metallibacterium sp.]